MPTAQFGGPIGPYLDNVQQRGVPVSVSGTCDYQTAMPVGDVARLENDIRNQVMRATHDIIGAKMANGELTFRNLGEGTLGTTVPEIIQASGLAQMGVQVGDLAMRFAIDNGPPQREIRANIHVGGLHIHASSSGGVDMAGVGNQLVNKAKSALFWYVGGAVLVAAIGGGTLWYVKRTIHKSLDQAAATASGAGITWDGKSMLACVGNQELTFDGVTAKLSGPAVTAGGNCVLTLTNCDITADTGIEAGGNAVITLKGGSITSTALAVHAAGNAKVNVSGTKLTGKTQAQGGAKITGI